MFLMLNMAGALTSYQSFLENGSTLRWDRAEEAFNIFPGSDPPGTSSPLPYGLREEARTPQTPEGPPSPSPSPGPGPSRAHATGEAQARARHDSSRHPPPSTPIRCHPPPSGPIRGPPPPPGPHPAPAVPLPPLHFLLGALLAALGEPLVLADRHRAGPPAERPPAARARLYESAPRARPAAAAPALARTGPGPGQRRPSGAPGPAALRAAPLVGGVRCALSGLWLGCSSLRAAFCVS